MDITAEEIWIIVSSLVTFASVVVKITPTPVDDGVVAAVYGVFKQLALTPKQK